MKSQRNNKQIKVNKTRQSRQLTQSKSATMKLILRRRLAFAYSIVIVSVGVLIVDLLLLLSSSSSGVIVDAAPAVSCIDDPNRQFFW